MHHFTILLQEDCVALCSYINVITQMINALINLSHINVRLLQVKSIKIRYICKKKLCFEIKLVKTSDIHLEYSLGKN